MTRITDSEVDAMIAALRNFPADGQLRDVDRDTATLLIGCGFVSREEVQKRCPACGTPRYDYGFFRITPAGRVILELAERSAA